MYRSDLLALPLVCTGSTDDLVFPSTWKSLGKEVEDPVICCYSDI